MIECVGVDAVSGNLTSKVPELVQWSTLSGYDYNHNNLIGREKTYGAFAKTFKGLIDSCRFISDDYRDT